MKRIGYSSVFALVMTVALVGSAFATPVPNSAALSLRVFNDCPLSTLTPTNSYPASIVIDDVMHPACVGFANLHSWSFSEDGGATPSLFVNGSNFYMCADVTIDGPGQGEGGLRFGPWWSPLADGRFMINAEAGHVPAGEVACFGGRLPFYSFTVASPVFVAAHAGIPIVYGPTNPDGTRRNEPIRITDPNTNPGVQDGLGLVGNIIGWNPRFGTSQQSLRVPDPFGNDAYSHNWFVGTQAELVGGFVLEANYIGNIARNLGRLVDYNTQRGDLFDGVLNRLNPGFGGINFRAMIARSEYHGLQLQLNKRYAQGFTGQIAYTLGKAMDDGSDVQIAGFPVDARAIELYRRALVFIERTGDEAQARQTLLKIGLTHHLAFEYAAADAAFGEAFARPAPTPQQLEPSERVTWALTPTWGGAVAPGHGAQDKADDEVMLNLFRGLLAIGPALARPEASIPLGLVAGYWGGRVGDVIMRVTDVFLAVDGRDPVGKAVLEAEACKTFVPGITEGWETLEKVAEEEGLI